MKKLKEIMFRWGEIQRRLMPIVAIILLIIVYVIIFISVMQHFVITLYEMFVLYPKAAFFSFLIFVCVMFSFLSFIIYREEAKE